MLTSGDVQFEPSAGSKIIALTNSIFMMTAGDAGLQTQIGIGIYQKIHDRIVREPSNWWRVEDVANLYIAEYNEIRKKRADDALLKPLYLDRNSFISAQNQLKDSVVNDLTKELLNYPMPIISAILAGVDIGGA
jgi:hypothetical protein